MAATVAVAVAVTPVAMAAIFVMQEMVAPVLSQQIPTTNGGSVRIVREVREVAMKTTVL
ncbi:MAG: hypothetical protein R3B47_14980 [Bacteroidia bacterium]